MKSVRPGKNTSSVQVTNVSPHGFWLLLDEREMFVGFKEFPWFQDATIRQLTDVQRPASHHLHWPSLDVDLSVESIEHPDRFPLVSKAAPSETASSKRTPSKAVRASRAPLRG
jgi:hypothetical protein